MQARAILLLALVAVASGAMCSNPQTRVIKSYSVTNPKVADQSAFSVSFKLLCNNKAVKDAVLVAGVAGKYVSVATHEDGAAYQVTWFAKNSDVSAGTIGVQLFDEPRYADVQKGSAPDALATIPIDHTVDGGFELPVSSELIAWLVSMSLVYFSFQI